MPKSLRSKFPLIKLLDKEGKTFLDSAATAQKPKSVINSIEKFYKIENFPARRSIYPSASEISEKIEEIRAQISKFINANKTHKIVFTSGGTDSINLVAKSLPKNNQTPDKNVILTTSAEHNSNFAPWIARSQSDDTNLKVVPFPERGFFKASDFEPFLDESVKIIAVTMDSNVVGPVWEPGFLELKKLINLAKSFGILVLLDACQAIVHHKIDIEQLNADFLVFSGHKIGGPTGIGILCIENEIAENMDPFKVGGGNILDLDQKTLKLMKAPHKFEAGSLPVAQIIGLGQAISFFQKHNLPESFSKTGAKLCGQIIDFLNQFHEISILGNPDFIKKHGHVVSFAVKNLHSHDIAWSLGEQGVFVRAGDHCAKMLHSQFKQSHSLRVSFFAYSNALDIERFKKALTKTLQFFKDESCDRSRAL